MKKHQQASKKGDDPQRSKGGSSSMRRGVRYGECQKNHAANMGGLALDGCREFMASGEDGTSGALRCAACGCHRNFHRTELDNEETNNLKDKEMAFEDAAAVMLRGGSFEEMRQQIWECLKDPKVKRFSFHGWEGVGRSVFLRQVIDELSKQAKSHDEEEEGRGDTLYQIVWVTRPGSVRDVRTSISKAIQNADFLNVGEKNFRTIPNQKILLVLDDLRQSIDLDDVGLLRWESMVLPGSKVVITSHSKQIWSEMKSNVNIEESWEGLSDDEAWELLHSETTDIANSLSAFNINIDGDALMQSYTYLFLFPVGNPSNYHGAYWRIERLIGSFESWRNEVNVLRSLIYMLGNRAMILVGNKGIRQVSKSIVSKVVPILNRQGRCLVRCGLKLEEAPKVEEWDQDDLKMISLAGNRITTLTAQVGRPPNVSQLSTLILSKNPLLQEVSDDFFHNMQGLRVLDLSFTGIKSLPSSLSTLTNLRLLALASCPNLETLPIHLLHALHNLEALLLKKSPFPKLTQLSLDMMQHLYYLTIEGASNLTQLSLRGCRSFERLCSPKNLEILDLSSTRISQFDYFDFWRMKCLRRLDLLDTKHLKVVPWHQIDRLPQTLNWDHCSNHSPAEELHTNQGYCISVSDDKIFESLSKDSKLWEEYFKKFKFSIVSCDQRQQQQPKDAKYPFERTHFIYRGIFEAKTKYFTQFPEFTRSYDRCLEIGSTNDVPYSIRGVLYHTEFLSLRGNNSITRLSLLGVENMDSLVECRLEKCLNMQSLITTGTTTQNVKALSRIEILLVFDLTNLKSLCRGTLGKGSFARLKHMCLEHCHRLSTLFSSSVCLEKLEKLEIKFCYKLESLFEEAVEGQGVFPQLKELYLLKLPKLKCICNGNLPALEKLKVHGCRLLHKLPLPIATGNKLNTVVIGGHQEWKRNLKWEEQLINQGVKLKVPRAFKA